MPAGKSEFMSASVREINAVVLAWLLTQSENVLTRWGIDADLVERLRQIPVGDIKVGTEPIVRLDTKAMEHMLKILEARRYERILIDRAIRCSARHSLVHIYTGISRVDYRKRTRQLGYLRCPSGRISMLSMEEVEYVYARWKEITYRKQETLRALCVLSERVGIPLDRIWSSCGDGSLLRNA